jgi:hypothetical protein
MHTHLARPTNTGRRMRFLPPRLLLAAAFALSLAACQKPEPPPAPPPPPPPPPPPIVHRPVAATWNFQTGDVCTATAGGGALSMEIAVSRDTMTLTARLPRDAVVRAGRLAGIEFSGPSGAWTMSGRGAASHRVIASQPMTEDQAGEILILLGGGRINIGSRALGVPELRIPNGGEPGRDWFACVRRQLFP